MHVPKSKLKRRTAACGLCLLLCVLASCGPSGQVEKPTPAGGVKLQGAGSTFTAPLYEKWISEYERINPKVAIDYKAVGSGEGIQRFIAGTVDFGASDAAMTDKEIAKVSRGVQLVPVVAGSIVIAYNLPGVKDHPLKLPRDVYVDIFLGKIKNWNDARIQQANPTLKLPELRVDVVVRLDSSGTTFAFTNHLSAISQEWREGGPGRGKLIDWPGDARLARGNDGVAGQIKIAPGAIGYVEYGIAQRAGLAMAWLENKAGKFIEPTGKSGQATLDSAPLPDNLRAFFPDPAGPDSYPVVTYSWLLLYRQYPEKAKADAVKDLVRWCLDEGQRYNEGLGYLRLSPRVAKQATDALTRVD